MRKTRIIFVDDEPSVLASLRAVFRRDRDRWDIEFAPGGFAALDRLAAIDFAVDVIVTDMRMPDVDGAMLLERVKEQSAGTVRIILSGSADTDDLARAQMCAHELLTKPCSTQMIRETIERLLVTAAA